MFVCDLAGVVGFNCWFLWCFLYGFWGCLFCDLFGSLVNGRWFAWIVCVYLVLGFCVVVFGLFCVV